MAHFASPETHFTIRRTKRIGNKHVLRVSSLEDVLYLLNTKTEIEKHLQWRVSPIKPRAPCIQLTNFYYKVTEEFLVGELFNARNPTWHALARHMGGVTVIKTTQSSVVLQLPPELWNAAITSPPPKIAMFQPELKPYVPLQQCFRCARFGHISKHCSYSTACFRCGAGHEGPQCLKQLQVPSPACANCLRQISSSIGPPHAATNHVICPIAQARKRAINAQTIYDQQTFDVLLQQ